METTKELLETQLKKHGKLTVYLPDNTPLTITKEAYLRRDGAGSVTFDMDCHDLADYCDRVGLSLRLNN